jgi:hypothetical protein
MAIRRTVDLLPEIFRTKTNRQFLSATLDQLTQEPQVKRTQGFIGRRIGPGVNPSDNYVVEPTAQRADYQLEPGVVFLRQDTSQVEDAITYPGLLDAISLAGGYTNQQDRLWKSEYYTWDPFCDLDKFTNYSQYYWLPEGPESVDVSTAVIPLTDNFLVTRATNNYTFSGVPGENPTLTLVRGGNYRFSVNQPGHRFWIQTEPGIDGRIPSTPNISSRDVFGVQRNGSDGGEVIFDVPFKTAQDFFFNLQDIGSVDLVCDFKFSELNNVYVDQFLADNPNGIDGITNLEQRTVIFTNTVSNAEAGGWQITDPYDPLIRTAPNQVSAWVSYDVNGQPFDDPPYETQSVIITSGRPDPLDGTAGSFDSLPFDQTVDITLQSQRYSIWRINYVTNAEGRSVMRLSVVAPVPNLSKFRIKFGTVNSSTTWYKNSSGFFQRVPLLTAVEDVLWYQDSTNPEIFGRIKLVDSSTDTPIDVNEIVGAQTYVSPNGVSFTNGQKIVFRGPVEPAIYADREYYIEGVGTGPGIDQRVGFVDGEAYFGPFHVYQGQKMTGGSHGESFHQFIYDSLQESLENLGQGSPEGAPLPTKAQPGATDGNGIKLIPVPELITPESYTRSETIPYDITTYGSTPYDAALNFPALPDYITINRASHDRNPWSRSNRWFHVDVIRRAADFNNTPLVLDNRFRAQRPIVEFRANLGLYNAGTQGLPPIDIIDFQQTDALSNVNGTTGYGVDGFELLDGSRIIFAADQDANVRDKIYRVDFIRPDGDPNTPLQINLVPDPNTPVLINQTVVCRSGLTLQGVWFWFDGSQWIRAQQKNSINQAPLFDIVDQNNISLGNREFYPSSDFQGSRLFGYAVGGTQRSDDVLGFALQYQNINNVGDILFENYFYTDTFKFVSNTVGQEQPVSQGFVRQFIDRVTFSNQIGWQPAAVENRARQVFKFIYDGTDLVLDVPVDTQSILPPIQIFLDGVFVEPRQYDYSIQGLNTFVSLNFAPAPGATIEVQALSSVASSVAFYQVPLNLESNPLNQNSRQFTLGTIRAQYQSIGQNLKNIIGPIIGDNNSRDLGNILPFGDLIVQHSSPLTLSGVFLRDVAYDIIPALTFNDREYNKYKAQLIDLSAKGDFINLSPTEILDTVIQEISLSKSEKSPFYWSDMIASGDTFTESTTVVTFITTPVFDINQIYSFDTANYQSVLVYLNDRLLTKGLHYTVSIDSPTITVIVPLSVGDVVRIREYSTTVGSFVPNTPTKLGLYPAYRPEIFVDESYIDPTLVIRGHDGSITVAYGDLRDQVLLEFETRIYNNLKVPDSIPIDPASVIPGQFRTTDYSLSEITEILSTDFLSWVGWNKLDYISQTYIDSNAFTFNYSQSADKLSGTPLLGSWRGIYNYFYDTISPTTTPWEMLGFSQQPVWWESEYGPAPYTSGNLVLWHDLETGTVRDPRGSYVLPRRARPGLLSVIPAGSEGELLSPLQSVVGRYDDTSFRRSWTVGDDGPTENAWRTSSSWPFAVMRLLALTRPAEFFSLGVDRDRYQFDNALEQWLWDGRYRLDAKQLGPLYGSGISKASFINWIVDYNQQQGTDSSQELTTRLQNLDVRLCWRVAGFTDKKYLKIYAERSTPTGSNAGLLLPDESYQILLYKNQPFEQATFSSVIVQRTDDGWAVYGYNPTKPYFNILVSRAQGIVREITSGGTTVRLPTQYTDSVARVPYGFVFTNRAAVCDFLLSYGQVLTRQGFVFDLVENGYILDWDQMAQEFLYWSNQGWVSGSVINLNPAATAISVTRPGTVAESLVPSRIDNLVLNQNRQPLNISQLVIDRQDNTFAANTTGSDTINYLNLRLTAYENLIVLDNRSIFADLIYDPVTGARQSRVRISGIISSGWDGTVSAPGFIINQDSIRPWKSNQKYVKGEIVEFKDELWVASTIIEPSQQFDYSLWVRSDSDMVQVGLLPNAPNSSDQLATAYDVNTANLEQETNLFSYGLIGFRPREYMQALDLNDVSQVNLYRQFIGSKGTRPSAEIFSLADLGKETAEYNIYEYWSIQQSTYGANANRSYFEILLDEAKLTSDPSVIQVIQPGQISSADQTVLLSELWKQSFKIPSADILPTLSRDVTDISLPAAGYVNLDDVDITLFDIDNTRLLTQDLDKIGVGTTIWVAKINPYDWNVYQAIRVPGEITEVADNLDGLSLVTFDKVHGLSAGDSLIIRFFSADIDGAYRVISTPSIFSLIIEYTFVGDQTQVFGQGTAFTLQSLRFSQPSDLATLSTEKLITDTIRVWIDKGPNGRWLVLDKQDVWQPSAELTVPVPRQPNDSEFGFSVSQGFFNLTALVGAPGYDIGSGEIGGVYAFGLGSSDQLEFNTIITSDVIDTGRFGSAIDIGLQNWAVVGSPASANNVGYATVMFRQPGSDFIEQRQVLIPENTDGSSSEKFGTSVTMSQDERYVFVGAPESNRVYAYARVDVQTQSVEYITNGETDVYNWSNAIKLPSYDPPLAPNYPQQISVILDNAVLQYGIDWNISGGNIQLESIPAAGQRLILTRRQGDQLAREIYTNVSPDISVTLAGSGVKFDIEVLSGAYIVTVVNGGSRYEVGDTFTILGTNLGGSSPANDLTITVTAPVGEEYRGTLTESLNFFNVNTTQGLIAGQKLVKISGDGNWTSTPVTIVSIQDDNQITVDVPASQEGFIRFYATPNAVTSFSRSGTAVRPNSFELYPRLATVTDIYSFTVLINQEIYRPFIDYSFDQTLGILTFDGRIPPLGSTILVISSTHWKKIATIDPGLTNGDRFGESVTTTTDGRQLIIGSPGVDRLSGSDSGQGRAFVYAKGWQKFIVANPNENIFQCLETLLPVTYVRVNGVYLLDSAYNIGGGFSVDLDTNSVVINQTLATGDIVEIETNSFLSVQEIASNNAFVAAEFGAQVDQCVNDCSLYISAPLDGQRVPQGGKVEFLQNQSRIYGTITSGVANPTLMPDVYIFVNGVAVKNTGSTVATLANDINSSLAPNVLATVSADLILRGDGDTRVFNIGPIYSDTEVFNTVVYLGTNELDQELLIPGVDYTYDNNDQTLTFATVPFDNAFIKVVSGRLTISAKNSLSAEPLDKLSVLPVSNGDSSINDGLFDELRLQTYVYQQTILPPIDQDFAKFGSSIFISEDTTTLAVGAPNASLIRATTFDNDTTVFDAKSTVFSTTISNSGAVYIYNFLPSYQSSVLNPGQFVFGQQIFNENVGELDRFGQSVDITTGRLLMGAPGNRLEDPSGRPGTVFQNQNFNNASAWQPLRIQQPTVDVNLLNTLYIYNLGTSTVNTYLDYFDPLQGKLLGPVKQNLDYIGAVDPAQFNVGLSNNRGETWGQEHVGEMWWDTTNCRFIDPNQGDITYASRRWGQLFPGSDIEVYQWISSQVPPAAYTGPGSPRSNTSYSVSVTLNQQGIFEDIYYYWVRGIRNVDRSAGKTLSASAVAQYIENPRASGIPYLAPLASSTVALYNSLEYINAVTSVLHIEYDRQATENAVHVQYQLIAADRPRDFLNDTLYRKLQDSFSGADTSGNPVPDPLLPPSEKYGVDFRPRQSFFVNRFAALENYLTTANAILSTFPARESRQSQLLDSSEPEPSSASNQWDLKVANLTELGYQDIQQVPLGYRYLVVNDSSNRDLWTIYEVQSDVLPGSRKLGLIRVQNFNTKLYWKYVDWYQPGYNPQSRIVLEVQITADLDRISVPDGSSVKVAADGQGFWEIYLKVPEGWQRVGLEQGTIEFSDTLWNLSAGRFGFDSEVFDSQYYDEQPTIETRQIIRAINEELFINNLAIEKNRLLILMFEFILSEQAAPSWLNKTSLIDVDHVIRELEPFQLYRQDNQDFVLNYIQEVKPYHSQIREFNLIYRGSDQYLGSVVDFDLPAQWDPNQQLFISPVLDDGAIPVSVTSSFSSDSLIWQQFPYDQWYQNYLLSVLAVDVIDGGTNYNTPPQVRVLGDSERPAQMIARINSAGRVVEIIVVDPGQGYLTTAIIVIEDGNGIGAKAVARMGNQLVRSLSTSVKYDRYQYNTDIFPWSATVSYASGDRVRFDDRVWQALTDVQASQNFDLNQWQLISASDLSGVDRTMGFYVPGPDQPGLDLALLISGVDYPGVQVSAPRFDQDTGFDTGNYDINPFDNLSFGPEGLPSYDQEILDAIYESQFTDPFLMVDPLTGAIIPDPRPGAIEVSGGAFVDTYSSHAPEELVPGVIFDTLDLRVFTTPGSDWLGDGHGFPSASLRFEFDTAEPSVYWGDLLQNALTVSVLNASSGSLLTPGIDYSVDWVNSLIVFSNGVSSGDSISITAYALGGGNQLITKSVIGDGVTDTVVLPRSQNDITEIVLFINGQQNFDFEYTALGDFSTQVIFSQPLTVSQLATLTALGPPALANTTWSLPITQYWVSDGSQSLSLINSMRGTNPANIVVTRNGRRATPAAGQEYIADGSTVNFLLPNPGGYPLEQVADNDVAVYLNDRALILGVDFELDPFDVSSLDRAVTLTRTPNPGDVLLISVRTGAQYFVVSNTLQFRASAGFLPQPGDIVAVTTWNDTREQNIITKVFVGPRDISVPISQGYDSTLFDQGDTVAQSGSFDFSVGSLVAVNRFDLERVVINTDRLLVSFNGRFLLNGQDYRIEGSDLLLPGPVINASDTLVVTMFADTTVPGEIAFRIFQDMRGLQTMYRITASTSTELSQPLLASDDVITVNDASRLSEPNLELGILGVITIGGERITYRQRDIANNQLLGLRRGTAGTGVFSHVSGTPVYSMDSSNALPIRYQNRFDQQTFLADGTQKVFVSSQIEIDDIDSTEFSQAVEVFLGGLLQIPGTDYTITDASPLTVDFTAAPPIGYEVLIRIERAESLYRPGINTASDGRPLQETQTLAARFIRHAPGS